MRLIPIDKQLRFAVWFLIDYVRKFTADDDRLDGILMDLSGRFASADEVEAILDLLAE